MKRILLALAVLFESIASLGEVGAVTCQDTYTNLPTAPVFPTSQYAPGSTPPLSSLLAGHWSELVQVFRPAPFTPTANPAQTLCPHLTGTLVPWHSFGYATGQDITLPENTRVLVHSCSIEPGVVYGIVTIPATSELIFGDSRINFSAKSIRVFGKILAGSETCRLRNKLSVTLYGSRAETPTGGDTWTKGIHVTNGVIEIHGSQYFPTWTRLARTILPLDTVILIQDLVNWQVNQTILVTTTELKDSRDYHRNEERIIKAIYTTVHPGISAVEVTEPFSYKHFAGKAYQAEVALISRNIIIQGDPDNSEPTDKDNFLCSDTGDSTYPCNNAYLTGFGAHVRVEGSTSIGRFSGVEWFRVGQTNILGRYAIHFHMIGQSVATGQFYVRDSSVHRSYFRAFAVHGTNNVLISQNVAYDVIGHAYFLEDGVEELNTFEYNLGSLVHWLGDTQRMSQGSYFGSQDLYWVNESSSMILPSDSGASVFYITNAYNRFIGNTASGGWAGFAFPNLRNAVKLSQNYLNGSFTPEARPTLEFKGNTAHSTGYWFQSAGGVYVGGTLKHVYPDGPLTYTAGRDGSRDTCLADPKNKTAGQNGGCNSANQAFMIFEHTKIFLANRGAQHWGSRSEVRTVEVHDTGLSMNVFGKVFITNMLMQCRSQDHVPQTTCPSRYCNARDSAFWGSFFGFQWYDVGQRHIVTRAEFRNCDRDWALCTNTGCNGASTFRTLTHSNQFVPEVMQSTKLIKFTRCNPDATLRFTVNNTLLQTVSGRLTNWVDADGSVFPDAYPGQSVILGSRWANNWWRISDACMGPKNDVWICPKNQDSIASMYFSYDPVLEGLIGSNTNNCPNGNGTCQIIGQLTHFGRPLADGIFLAQNPKITGPVIKSSGGWFLRFNAGTPKVLAITRVQLHPDDNLLIGVPYPRGSSLNVIAFGSPSCSSSWARCNDTLVQATSVSEVLSANGDKWFYDANLQMLYLKIVQVPSGWTWSKNVPDTPHTAWPRQPLVNLTSFQRDGITLMEGGSASFRFEIRASNCGNGASSLYCAPVAPTVVPPALSVAPPIVPGTFAPTLLKTKQPTTKAPTANSCKVLNEQCAGGGPNAYWEQCCYPNQECVVQSNLYYGSCRACANIGEQCAGLITTPSSRCCASGSQCVVGAADPTKSFCLQTAPPSGPPTTLRPSTFAPSKNPTSIPTTRSPTPPTSAPTFKTSSPIKQPTIAPVPTVHTNSPSTKTPTAKSTAAPLAATAKPSLPSRRPTLAPTLPTRRPTTRFPTKRPTRRRRRG